MPGNIFKKLSNDAMCKLVLSKKRYMNWFLERFLNKKLFDYKIINKIDNNEINEKDVLKLLKQELISNNVHVKNKTVDLLVKMQNEIIDLEVNNTFDENIRKRNFAYMANIYSNSLEHGQTYDEQPKCIQINICNNIDYEYDFDNHCLLGEHYNNKFIDNINFMVFNVAKYKKILYTGNRELIEENLHLIMFDCNDEELEMLEEYDEKVKEIRKLVNKYNDDSTIYQFLTTEEDQEKMNRTRMLRAVEKNKLETAQKMLKKNYPISDISEMTGYSLEYLQSINV